MIKQTVFKNLINSTPVVFLMFFFMAGCDEHWAKRLEHGSPVPDARIELELPYALSKADLYQRYKSAAGMENFTVLGRNGVSGEEAIASNKPSYEWYRTDPIDTYDHHIGFRTPRKETESTLVTFVFYKHKAEPFTKDHWLAFYKWKDEHLPQVFPEAAIRVVRHPAEFTVREDIGPIANETGIEVPEKYLTANEL